MLPRRRPTSRCTCRSPSAPAGERLDVSKTGAMDEAIQIGRWLVRPDVPRTREAHSKLARSGAAECSCTSCQNFETVRPRLLAGPLGRILDQLGISPPWEVEVYEGGRSPSGLHHYGGWFHFVGTIESGGDAWLPVGSGAAVCNVADFDPLSETLSVGFHTDLALVREPFKGLPLVQLEIAAELPWVIAAEEPR